MSHVETPLALRDYLLSTLHRFDAVYAAAARGRPALAAYDSLSAALRRLAPGRAPPAEQAAIVSAFVAELHDMPHEAWRTALLIAFAPALQRLCKRERLETSELVASLLEAAQRTPPDAKAIARRLVSETTRRARRHSPVWRSPCDSFLSSPTPKPRHSSAAPVSTTSPIASATAPA